MGSDLIPSELASPAAQKATLVYSGARTGLVDPSFGLIARTRMVLGACEQEQALQRLVGVS